MQKIADKYNLSVSTLYKRSKEEDWQKLRKKAYEKGAKKALEKISNKTSDAAANNAVKLEKARALLIDKIITALEQMPKNSGTHVRQTQMDKQTGKQMSLDYDLSALVVAFEKLSSGATADYERQKQFAEENNTTLMGYADLFKRAARTRTIEELEGGDADV